MVLRGLDPFPSADEAAALYGDEYFTEAANAGYADYQADEPVHRRNGRARVRRLGPPPPSSSTLVDVGCAFGFTMVEAAAAGWEPTGIEVNATARDHVRSLGMRCEPDLESLQLAAGTVGAVTFFQALEHLPDPLAALRWSRSAVVDDGSVVIETWDRTSRAARILGRRWYQASPPGVLWLFDERSLRALASAAGLELVSFRRTSKWVTLGLVAGQLRDRGDAGVLVRVGERLRRVQLPFVLDDLVTVVMRPVTGG